MDKYFVITIDVEPDCSPSWRYSKPLSFYGVQKGIKERLQPLFNKYGAFPTYLINNVVLEDRESTETFLRLEGGFELGTHLHSEFIEPEKKFTDYAGVKAEANQCFLPAEIEFEKMRSITNLFENNFGRRPTSFRAGRFSAGTNTIQALDTLGYKVDTSVTPHINWNDKTRERSVNYTHAFEQPYFIKPGSYLEKSKTGKILEVPVSIIDLRRFFRKKAIWLRPSYYKDFSMLLKVIEAQSAKFSSHENVVFNMMFHNVEVLPQMSPYTLTESDCTTYLSLIESFLSFCKKNSIKSLPLSSTYDIFNRKR